MLLYELGRGWWARRASFAWSGSDVLSQGFSKVVNIELRALAGVIRAK